MFVASFFSDVAQATISETLARALLPPGYDLGSHTADGRAFALLRAGRVEGYIFDTLDYAAPPGFSGAPIEMAVALDERGTILGVTLLNQSEPVFQHGMGVKPFTDFLAQYRGKSIRSNIAIGGFYGDRTGAGAGAVEIDGIAKATASVRIANVTILASAITVARAHMAGAAPLSGAKVRADLLEPLNWTQAVSRGYIQKLELTNADLEKAFAGTIARDFDPGARAHPEQTYARLYFALADIPSVGVALFGRGDYDRLMAYIEPGDHVIAVLSDGPWRFLDENFVRGGQPMRIAIDQDGFGIGARDIPADFALSQDVPPMREVALLRVPGSLGFDPAAPWRLSMTAERRYGQLFPIVETQTFSRTISYPARLFTPQARTQSEILQAWRSQTGHIAALAVLLAVLWVALAKPAWATRRPRRFRAFRLGFLLVVLVWLGWIAQGQLSIVTLLGLVKTLVHGGGFAFLLFDPIGLILWIFVLVTLVVWGRGAFCGWLCPFGALQEFAAALARALGLPSRKVPPVRAAWAVGIKYGVLAFLIAGTAYDAGLAETLAEAEPFKTAITLGFVRDARFVAYAAGLLLWGMVVYKPYCRFLCPLGAGLALGGRIRRRSWIPRRDACGAPCRLCENRCEYGAIDRSGAIAYHECFQCLECVAIYHDRNTCPPLVLHDRRAARGSA
jgi:transcriptional regulator of nitric oxide reductase